MGDNRSPFLTDSELRRRLKDEFNFNCGPVTDSTRSIYLKKLDNFVKERNKETNSRRQTVGSFESSLNHDSKDDVNSSFVPGFARHSPRNVTRRSVAATAYNDNHENGRLTPVKDNSSETPGSGRKLRLSPKQSTPKVNEESPASTRITRRRTINSAALEASNSPRRKTLGAPNATLNAYSSEESAEEEPEGGRSVLYNYMTSRKSKQTLPQMRSTPTKVPLPRVTPPRASTVNTVTTPFGTRRSTRGKLSPPISAASFLANYSDSEPENDTMGQAPSTESIRDRLLKHRQPATRRKTNVGFKKSNNNPIVVQANEYSDDTSFYSSANGSSSSNSISFIILCVVIAFFVSILSLYVYSRFSFVSFGSGDHSQLELDVNAGSKGIIAPICDDRMDPKCFKNRENVTAALFLVKTIQNFIQRYSYQYLCEDYGGKVKKDDPFLFNMVDIRNEVLLQKEKYFKFTGINMNDENGDVILFTSLNNAIKLIQLNTRWNIEVDRNEVDHNVADYFLRIDPNTYQLSLPFSCQVKIYLTKTMKYIGLSMIVIAIVWAVFTYVHKKRKQAAELKEQIYDLVEKSVDLLQSPDNPQSMPVIHIRDMLFSTQERQSAKCMKLWAKVVAFIEEHESRVKVGIEKIDGEEYKTWKWISTNKGNTSCDEGKNTTMKTGTIEWQGQAFCEEGQSGENSVMNETVKKATSNSQSISNFFAPTQFLKVRNMFTAEPNRVDSNWKVNIENALLEKCSANSVGCNHGILHISVEDNNPEGIVYIKCDSLESATHAFNQLHGWWCEKNLVSVRFLTEERYYSRFPEARDFDVPLQIRNISC